MGETDSAGVVMRSMVEMFDTGNVGPAASVVSPDYVDHQGLGTSEIVGVEGFCRVVSVARNAFISLDVVIDDLIVEDDRAAARLVWRGTSASGEQVPRETIDIVKVAAGLAIEHWGSRLA
jgi:predicted ester cyclase